MITTELVQSLVVALFCLRSTFIFCAAILKAGKDNVTTSTPGLFGCKEISFKHSFSGGQQVKVFASFGHTVKSPTHRYGAAVWVESVSTSGFTVCVLEYGEGSKGSAEVNWIALQSAPSGSQLGTVALDPWTTGTECITINFKQRFTTSPTILVSASHEILKRPQDAMAVWVKELNKDNFKVCFRETKIHDGLHKEIRMNWMAFTTLKTGNFTLSKTLMLNLASSKTHHSNNAFCQIINFTDPFYAPPVVVVTPKQGDMNNHSGAPPSQCSAITAWVEFTSRKDTKLCVRRYKRNEESNNAISIDYVFVGDLDPCLDVTCYFYGLCKAFGPHDARCVCLDLCPPLHEPVCSSNGTTYGNECWFKRETCLLRRNFTVQHPGRCEVFPFQRGRKHMPHIPTLGYFHCEVIHLQPYVFYPDKPIEVQITVNYMDTSEKSYVHDAVVSWVENTSYNRFTACVMAAGFSERKSNANVTVDWMAYQGAPVGGLAGEEWISQWWTGTTCKAVNFPSGKFNISPSVFVTAEHHHSGLKRDAASVWIEDVTKSSCKVCLRELQNYAGSHKDISVNWFAFVDLHKPPFLEHGMVPFINNKSPPDDQNDAFCKDVSFLHTYHTVPNVLVSANHSTKGGNLSPVHNGITAWIEVLVKIRHRYDGERLLRILHIVTTNCLSLTYASLSQPSSSNKTLERMS
ncbi:uncharacterized protein LOC111343322 [Stylophora pistillata]|uniref:uncharacterized protein LOC111343322 n=1 Tax=Stylophora pistillata TaxID=50429 RepID=UPI000C04129F|nr:uncharacterized protein LOC111343322 [Stylophora pistillata]